MSNKVDDRQIRFGAEIGTGRVRRMRYQNHLPARYTGPKQQHLVSLKDIDNRFLKIGTRVGEKRRGRMEKDVERDLPMSMAVSKVQIPDTDTYSFDRMTQPAAGVSNVPANAVDFALVTLQISQAIRGVVKRFGWYTIAGAAATNLTFGLYIGEELVIPGGKFVGDQPRTVLDYDPSGGSIDFEELAHCHLPVSPDTQIRILVNNADPVNAYPAFGRVFGMHWEEETREDGRRAYYNEDLDKIR